MAVLKARLAEYGVPVYDCTKRIEDRGAEIKEWLEEHKGILGGIRYVVLDDEVRDIVGYIGNKGVIEVDGENGLTFRDSIKAIDFLNSEENMI